MADSASCLTARLSGFARPYDHGRRQVPLTSGWQYLAHDLDELGGEEGIRCYLVNTVGRVAEDLKVGETYLLNLPGEDTLRHGAANSTGPGGVTRRQLRRQLFLQHQVSNCEPAARP